MELHVLSQKIGYATNSSSYHNMIVWDGEKYEGFKSGEYMINGDDELGLIIETDDGKKFIKFDNDKVFEVLTNSDYDEGESFEIDENCKYYYMYQPRYAGSEYEHGLMDFEQWDDQQCEHYEVIADLYTTPSGDKVYFRSAFGYDY